MARTESPALIAGIRAPAFLLPGVDGRSWRLDDVAGARGTVVVFMCNHCPYVKAIRERLVDDAAALLGEGIGFVGINSNDATAYPEDSFERMQQLARDWRLPFPYLFDESQRVARDYGAVCTPDFFGFDGDMKLRWRGRLDAAGRGPRGAQMRRELVEAMTAIADGREPPFEQLPSIGCSIKWRG